MGKPDPSISRCNRDRKAAEANKKTKAKPGLNTKKTNKEEKVPCSGMNQAPNTDEGHRLSARFDILYKRKVGSLVVAQLNVEKIGKTKREVLARLLEIHGIDCLAVTEHHIPSNDYVQDKYSSQLNLPTLKIKGFSSASKHRDESSGGVAWYQTRRTNLKI